jgi:hypothetical protein
MSEDKENYNTISIMQPYFFPYPGYFELPAQADLFVLYDDVQFPRRGWVHRNKFHLRNSKESDWWGLPIKKSPQTSTLIGDLRFDDERIAEFKNKFNRFELSKMKDSVSQFFPSLFELNDYTVLEYLEIQIQDICNYLKIDTKIIKSSDIPNPNRLKSEDRIIQICKFLGADRYLNASGGVDLYEHRNFSKEGIELNFLPEYTGNKISILEQIAFESI